MAGASSSRGLVLLVLTSSFFITGLIFDYMPTIIDDHIKRTIELATNEEIISFWSKPPVDVHSYYWLYDVLNAEQFKTGERVQVRKIGPFHFTSRVEKQIIELSANKYRIIYNSSRLIRLNESYPGNDLLDEQLTLLNPIYGSICEGARVSMLDMDAQGRSMVASSINRLTELYNETLFINTTARLALLGRQVSIVEKMRKMAQTFGLGSKVPEMLPDKKFGYVALSNNTPLGPFEIYTGYQETAKSLGELISYKGKRRLSYYDGRCNRLQASVGELRPMPIDGTQKLEMFAPSFCRIVHLRPTGIHKIREGLAINYVMADEDFMSAEMNPDNRCFCINGTQDNYCSLNGALELAPCLYNSPIVITTKNIPLDRKITSSIQNWDPDLVQSELDSMPTNDSIQVMILKRMGVPFFVDITVTMFMKIIRDPQFKQTISVPEVSYIPLVMIRDTVTIPPRLSQIIVNLESFLALTYHIKVIMYLSAIILFCWLTGFYYCRTSQTDRVVPTRQSQSGSGAGGARGSPSAALANGRVAPSRGQPAEGQDASGRQSSGASLAGGQADQRNATTKQQGDTASSERANSADSSRSQPPSRRASQVGSLDVGDDNLAAAGARQPTAGGWEQNCPQQQREGAVAAEMRTDDVEPAPEVGAHQLAHSKRSAGGRLHPARQATGAPGAGEDDDEPGKYHGPTESNGQTIGAGARIFSKVDEELRRLASGGNQEKAGANGAHTAMPPPDGHQTELAHADGLAPSATSAQNDIARTQRTGTTKKKARKNWFMNVYSNFVRMLNDLRSTISDASQLDISENDYQDKQLEMLAGKIDNWYSGRQPSPSSNGTSEQMAAVTPDANEQPYHPAHDDGPREPKVGGAADAGDRQRLASSSDFETSPLSFSAACAPEIFPPAIQGQQSIGEGNGADNGGDEISATKTKNSSEEFKRDEDANRSGARSVYATHAGSAKRNRSLQSLDRANDDGDDDDGHKTVVTSRSDTGKSGDMVAKGLDNGHSSEEEARLKAAVLEQVEAALNNDGSSGNGKLSATQERHRDLNGSPASKVADESISAAEFGGKNTDDLGEMSAGRPTMINSSTSIDSVINLTEVAGGQANGKQVEASGKKTLSSGQIFASSRPNQSASRTATKTTKLSEQIDESSPIGGVLLKQSNKWSPNGLTGGISGAEGEPGAAPNGLVQEDGRTVGSNVDTNNDNERDDHQNERDGGGQMTMNQTITNGKGEPDNGQKDERRDIGVKLDSRNGISSIDKLSALAKAGQSELPVSGPPQAAKANKKADKLELDEQRTIGATGPGLDGLPSASQQGRQQVSTTSRLDQQQQQQIKGTPTTNGIETTNTTAIGGQPINGSQAKLLQSDGINNGNNILNGKIMLQQQQLQRIQYSDRTGITSPSLNQTATNETPNQLQPAGA